MSLLRILLVIYLFPAANAFEDIVGKAFIPDFIRHQWGRAYSPPAPTSSIANFRSGRFRSVSYPSGGARSPLPQLSGAGRDDVSEKGPRPTERSDRWKRRAYLYRALAAKREGIGSCNGPVQSDLLFGCANMLDMAKWICCYNTEFAEPSGYFKIVGGAGGLFHQVESSGVTIFYDSVCGKPLFRAPVGRSFVDWKAETEKHGWPSFRAAETVHENVIINGTSGQMKSVCGTHLGHNIPDANGDRYCIDLVCIAGSPREHAVGDVSLDMLV